MPHTSVTNTRVTHTGVPPPQEYPIPGCHTSAVPRSQGAPSQGCPQLRGTFTSGVSPPQGSPHFVGTSRSGVPHLRGAPHWGAPPQGYFQIMGAPPQAIPHLRVSHLRDASPQGYFQIMGVPPQSVPPEGYPLPRVYLTSGMPHTWVPHLRWVSPSQGYIHLEPVLPPQRYLSVRGAPP